MSDPRCSSLGEHAPAGTPLTSTGAIIGAGRGGSGPSPQQLARLMIVVERFSRVAERLEEAAQAPNATAGGVWSSLVEERIRRWLSERCRTDPNGRELSRDLFADFQAWAQARNIESGTLTRLARYLRWLGYPRWVSPRGGKGFRGLTLHRENAR